MYPWHGANVVFVSVRDNDRLYLITPTVKEASIWQDLLHAQVCEAVHIITM